MPGLSHVGVHVGQGPILLASVQLLKYVQSMQVHVKKESVIVLGGAIKSIRDDSL